jgi:single-strand DNA-binding protein
MRTYNKVLIIGNLTKDPEIKELDSGVKVANFTVATNHNKKGKDGEKLQLTDYHNVVAWRRMAEVCAQYLKKGAPVMIEGKLNNTIYENKEGKKVKNVEIQAEEVNFINYNKKANIDEINLVEVEA